MGRRRTESDAHYIESANDEIFSGPTHELVPSSYSSFHHHNFPREESDLRRSSSLSRSRPASIYSQDEDYPHQHHPRLSRSDSVSSFHFFSHDEVNNAEGSSTVAGDVDPMDAPTGDNESGIQPFGSPTKPPAHGSREVHQYFGDDYSSDEEPLLAARVDDDFEYNSTRQVQKYYISEEDMRILFAGYRKVAWRRYCYYAFCVVTLGIGYLLLRWFPRQRIIWLATPCSLGNCDLIVVENQWNEIELLDVASQRYNNPLSTIFKLDNTKEDVTETVAAVVSHPNGTSSGPHNDSAILDDDVNVEEYVDNDPNVPFLRSVAYRYLSFHYNPVTDLFMTNNDWMSPRWCSESAAAEGLDSDQTQMREEVFGKNVLDIKEPSTAKLLVDEVLHPFYIFQVFSIILWLFDDYFYYAFAIFVISIFSVVEAFLETRSSYRRLAGIARHETELRVLRSGFWLELSSADLVPGDVFELSDPNLSTMPCDAVMLSGDCIVNESILTGESVPVSKIAADDEVLTRMVNCGANSIPKSFLYAGTKVIRVRKPAVVSETEDDVFESALAMVVRTGFTTTKGSLVRSMMFPRPSGFKFYRDSFRYIGVMTMVAMMGFVVSAVQFVKMKMETYLIIVRALDLITIVVPPALPATLTIGTNISLARLRKKDTFCITPSRLNVGGRLDIVCFDKTGTLTEDGLDVLGIHLFNKQTCKFGPLLRSAKEIPSGDPVMESMATCHELRQVDDELLGDPLDVKMFEFSGWQFEEDERHGSRVARSVDGETLTVVKQFDFVSALRRASVVISGGSTGLTIVTKGAPEVMKDICRANSLPSNFNDLLHEYTHRGYRVIACATRPLSEISDFVRESLESDLEFAGFIIFENKLKPSSRPVIQELTKARVRSVMCTGDNLLTALSVGRECFIIPPTLTVYAAYIDNSGDGPVLRWEGIDNPDTVLDPDTLRPVASPGAPTSTNYALAVTGDVFGHIIQDGTPDQLDQMLIKAAIYARMSPDEKHELVAKLQQIDYTTCFCGDGANDCGALKEADVGISLSEAEASVAAPFTSRRFEISCVLDVMREGRCALSTSFSCFQYMSLYSAIQFVTVSILYSYGSNIGDFQFLYIDLALIVPIAVFMAWSKAAPTLSIKRPGAKLVSRRILVPLIGSMIILGLFQFGCWKFSHLQSWYIPPQVGGDDSNLQSTDNTALFDISSFQYIFSGVLLCGGLPFRQPIYTNVPFLVTIAVTLAISVLFVFLNPDSSLGQLMDLTPTSLSFKFTVLGLTLLNYLVLVGARRWVYGPICDAIKAVRRASGKTKTRKQYKVLIENEQEQC